MSSFGIAFAPHLPLWLFAAFGTMALAILTLRAYKMRVRALKAEASKCRMALGSHSLRASFCMGT